MKAILISVAALIATTGTLLAQSAYPIPDAAGPDAMGVYPSQRTPIITYETGQVVSVFGGKFGDASEHATAYRGDYRFGDCPAGTIITTFGTCAVLR